MGLTSSIFISTSSFFAPTFGRVHYTALIRRTFTNYLMRLSVDDESVYLVDASMGRFGLFCISLASEEHHHGYYRYEGEV